MKNALILAAALALGCFGCHSHPTPKPTLSRGWIGGEYKTAKSKLVPRNQPSRVYVKQVFPGTPAEQAGLRLGDLIVAIDHQPVVRLQQFRNRIDATPPGTTTTVRVYRDGESLELPITIGRESYQTWHALQMGLGFSSRLDLWPNPEFSLLPIAQYKHGQKRVELNSAEMQLARQATPTPSRAEPGWPSEEGWKAWFLIFGVDSHKRILSQESVAAPTARR